MHTETNQHDIQCVIIEFPKGKVVRSKDEGKVKDEFLDHIYSAQEALAELMRLVAKSGALLGLLLLL